MLIEYIQEALEKTEYKKLENGTWFAEIPGFPGVWSNGISVEECLVRDVLYFKKGINREVQIAWIFGSFFRWFYALSRGVQQEPSAVSSRNFY